MFSFNMCSKCMPAILLNIHQSDVAFNTMPVICCRLVGVGFSQQLKETKTFMGRYIEYYIIPRV